HANQAAAVLCHEVDLGSGHFLGGECQIPFVLAILIVDDDDHFSGAEGVNRVFDTGKGAAVSLPAFRDLQFCGHTLLPISSTARTTYLPTMSHSSFTRSP